MKYNPPKKDGSPYWVPVVVKNKDYLTGYLEGVRMVEGAFIESLKQSDIKVNIGVVDLFLDSSRFNDILENGKRESQLSGDEKKKIIMNIIKEKTERIFTENQENGIDYKDILNVECQCGFGFYSWKDKKDIPNEAFKCSECGKVLIDYTNHNDDEFEFDEGDDDDNQES